MPRLGRLPGTVNLAFTPPKLELASANRGDVQLRVWAVSLAFAVLLSHSSVFAEQCTGTGLVLAIDASGSIDDAEFALQTQGTAAAILDPAVLAAIEASGGLSVAVVFWADEAEGVSTIPWDIIRGETDAKRFADRLTHTAREHGGSTDLGFGLWASLDMLDDLSPCVARRVIDISGDGRESIAPRVRRAAPLRAARTRAEAMGVTVNGLAVIDDDHGIEDYYRKHVATGPGSFVIAAHGFADFGRAMRAKFLREIAPPRLASASRGRRP
jgi:hypothetical protein